MRISDWSSDVCSSDLAVLIPGAEAPKLVTREMLGTMRPGSVLVDVAIDQGGCFETSHATTHAEPTYVVDGIVHYAVANMPGAVARTSTYALNNVTLPHALRIADRSEEHTSELQSLMRISYAVFSFKKQKTTQQKNKPKPTTHINNTTTI